MLKIIASCLIASTLPFIGFAGQKIKQINKITLEESAYGWYGVKISNTISNSSVVIKNKMWSVIEHPTQEIMRWAQDLNPDTFVVRQGTTRGQLNTLLSLPIIKKEGNQYYQLFSAEIAYEDVENKLNLSPLAKGTSDEAVFANGTFYKIAVSGKGIQKLDYDFFKRNINTSPEQINLAHLKIYGNSGLVIPENNATPYPMGIAENALYIQDGGDGVLNPGDYVLFYCPGTVRWEKEKNTPMFKHTSNYYANNSFYYITLDKGVGKRISTAAPINTTPTHTVTEFNEYAMQEEDIINVGKFGKVWWGYEMSLDPGKSNNKTITFNTDGAIGDIHTTAIVASVSEKNGNSVSLSCNGNNIWNISLGPADFSGVNNPASSGIFYQNVPNASQLNFNFQYNPASSNGKGYIDYVALNYKRSLRNYGAQTFFREINSVGSNNVTKFIVGNSNNNSTIWDVTNIYEPIKMVSTLNSSNLEFITQTDTLKEFVSFDGSSFGTPTYVGQQGNSNTFDHGYADYIIITHPDFVSVAHKFADYHRSQSGYSVNVAVTSDLYTEFASGNPDIGAIRNYLKLHYQRANGDSTKMPKFALLLGDASYDYKDRVPGNTNFVPTHESYESVIINNSFATDDYFTFLDEHENIEDYSTVNLSDIAIGRIPIGTVQEGEDFFKKMMTYKSPSSLGKWKLNATVIADNYDAAGNHLMDAEAISNRLESANPAYISKKIYLDNLPFVATPGGERCPIATNALNDAIEKGTFMVNYSGHGSPLALAHERVLSLDNIDLWNNFDKPTLFITATCDFAQFDRPGVVSAGEKLILKPNGGAIAMLTTSHAVFANQSAPINRDFVAQYLLQNHGSKKTYGDIYKYAKNTNMAANPHPSFAINTHKFVMLGDPGLQPNFPRYIVATDSIKQQTDHGLENVDTFNALGIYEGYASIRDDQDEVLTSFNGMADITIYDKKKNYNVPYKLQPSSTANYSSFDNIIYKGKVSVTNGSFKYSFIMPKDINYDFGNAKIVYYAQTDQIDAAGYDTSMIIGGSSRYSFSDDDAPIVKAFIGDSLFRDGSITGKNTTLFAIIEDESGINVSGSSIGHDLTAVLDGDEANPYILNDYYETAPNTYKRGYLSFPIFDIPDGKHTLKVKAWDVNNNSGEGVVNFEVVNGEVVKIGKVGLIPNPFSGTSRFIFEHNHPRENVDVTIRIVNTTGATVKTIRKTINTPTSNTSEIEWDGTSDNGALLPSGIYPFVIEMKTSKGFFDTGYQKAVITR